MSINIAGDKSVIDEKSRIVSRNKNYSDFDLKLKTNPKYGDIVALKDIEAVKQSVKNLVLTSKTERLFQPWLGSNIRGLLFEPADNITIANLKQEIMRVIQKYEPRVFVNGIDINDRSDINAYFVTIDIGIINLKEDVEVEFFLERVR